MSRYVRYHKDGSVRMDWYTFQRLPLSKLEQFTNKNRARKVKVKSHGTVKEFA